MTTQPEGLNSHVSRILLSNMLVNTNLALYPVKEAKRYGTGVTTSPAELVESVKEKALNRIDALSQSLLSDAGVGSTLFENLFTDSYEFPNKRAMKLINKVIDSGSRLIPLMTSDATLEGEGPEIGKFTLLTRIGGCAVACVGCDTPHSWNAKISDFDGNLDPIRTQYNQVMDIRDIADLIIQQADCYGLKRISITGGEPLHYIDALRLLVADLWLRGFYINIETSGTLFDPVIFSMCHVSLDIKTPSSRVKLSDTQIGAIHAVASYDHANPAHVKAVISNREDLEFLMDNFYDILTGDGKYRPICLTPWAAATQDKLDPGSMSTNVNEITSWVFENRTRIDSRQIRVIGQQHKLLQFV